MSTYPRHRVTQAVAKIVMLVGALMAAVALAPAPSASAFTVTDSFSAFGRITPNGAMITASGDPTSIALQIKGVTLGASAGSPDTQRVSITYRLEHHLANGEWKEVARSQTLVATISADETHTFPGWVFEDPYSDSAWHEFRITFTAQWIDVNTNSGLALRPWLRRRGVTPRAISTSGAGPLPAHSRSTRRAATETLAQSLVGTCEWWLRGSSLALLAPQPPMDVSSVAIAPSSQRRSWARLTEPSTSAATDRPSRRASSRDTLASGSGQVMLPSASPSSTNARKVRRLWASRSLKCAAITGSCCARDQPSIHSRQPVALPVGPYSRRTARTRSRAVPRFAAARSMAARSRSTA